MFKNKYEAGNSRFGEVLIQVLSAHGIYDMLVKATFAQVYRKGNRGIADNV